MIVAVGLIGTNFVTGLEMAGQEKFDALSSSSNIYGHITIVHSDPDGNILAYIQTDNLVAANGKNCMAELIFGEISGGSCTASRQNFTTIALYNGETFPITMNATDQGGTGSENLLETSTLVSVAGLTIRNGGQGVGVSENTPAVTTGGAPFGGVKIDITKTFTAGANVANQVVDGAALFNNGTGVGGGEDPTAVLAGQVFQQGSVTLNELDTLLITWTITLG